VIEQIWVVKSGLSTVYFVAFWDCDYGLGCYSEIGCGGCFNFGRADNVLGCVAGRGGGVGEVKGAHDPVSGVSVMLT